MSSIAASTSVQYCSTLLFPLLLLLVHTTLSLRRLGLVPQRSKKLVLHKIQVKRMFNQQIRTNINLSKKKMRDEVTYIRLKQPGFYCKDWFEATMEHNDLACIHAGSFPIFCKSGIRKFPINLYCGMLDGRCSGTSTKLWIGTWINWLFNTRIRKCWAISWEICRIQLLPHDHNPIVWTMRPAWALYHTWQAPAKLIHCRSWLDKGFWRVVIYEMSGWCACPG